MRKARLLLVLLLGVGAASLAADCGRERLLPRPEPLPEHEEAGLGPWEARKLGDIRRFLPPAQQLVLEQTLVNLETDSRLPRDEARAALKRALSGLPGSAGFCDRLRDELRPLQLTGPPVAEPPVRVGTAVAINFAHEHWLSSTGRRLYPKPLDLARAIRDGELADDAFAPDVSLLGTEEPLFLTDSASLRPRTPPPAQGLCLGGQPAHSYVVVALESAELGAPLRIPTAADAVCLPNFVLPPADADRGETCTGLPQFVTAPQALEKVREFRLSR
jgi:hypothetical protein